MAEMNDETIAHLRNVIAYSIADEKRQYEETIADYTSDDREHYDEGVIAARGHVYISLAALHEWVLENGKAE
jgi:hypothetical protein